jgi:hypothetical protein
MVILLLAVATAAANAKEFEVQKVADGVYAAIRTKPPA